MSQKEIAMIDRFTRGLTLFAEQLHLKNLIRYLDDNITAEQFVCQLMNTLYDMDYRSDNGTNGLTPSYDLISDKKSELLQISSSDDPQKIDDAHQKLQRLIDSGRIKANRYTLRFVFLVNDASRLKNCKAAERAAENPDFFFDPNGDILDFRCFAATVKSQFQFVPEKAEMLRRFMDYCYDIFPREDISALAPTDRVEQIIGEYAHNFDEPLFMHLYSDPPVTLRQLYVDPAFYHDRTLSRDIEGCLQQYIHNSAYNRERFFFIEGSAAIGKTSFVSWLCWHYQYKTELSKTILGKQKIICVRLRELEFPELCAAEQVLLNYLGLPDTAAFEDRYHGALLVLDGADELSMVSGIPHGTVEKFLLALQIHFRSHKFLITTRPQFLDMTKFKSRIFQFRIIQLAHYDEIMRAEWLNRYLSCGQTIPENTERFIRELRGREENGVADTPLALYLLAQCDAEDDLLDNQWALCQRIFSEAILKGEYNTNFSKSDDLMDTHIRSINYRVVQSIAFRIFQNASMERYYLNEAEIMEAIEECNLENLSPEQVRETCVLCAYWKNTGNIGALEFYHNNIRDFFLCEYLCQNLLECLRKPDPVEALVPMLCHLLCYSDICQSTWKQVYQYLCLRLDYESVWERSADSLYHVLQDQRDTLFRILPRVTAGRELWTTTNDSFVYRGAKQTFRNIYMLVRIFQSFCAEQIELTPRSKGSTTMNTMELFRDWTDMFRTPAITYVGHNGERHTIDSSSNTIYRHLDFSDKRITSMYFHRCDMKETNFAHTTMDQIWFKDSVLRQIHLDKALVIGGGFSGTTINGISALDASVTNTVFKKTKIRNIDGSVSLYKCYFHPGTFLEDADLENSSFVDVCITGICVVGADFRRTRFKNVWLESSTISNAHFHQTTFSGEIKNVFFENCYFDDSPFNCPYSFLNVTFRNCRFRYGSFRGIDLRTVKFENCNFQHTNNPQLTKP